MQIRYSPDETTDESPGRPGTCDQPLIAPGLGGEAVNAYNGIEMGNGAFKEVAVGSLVLYFRFFII